MNNILALDLGTQTGFALSFSEDEEAIKVVGGSISFKPAKYDGAGMRYLKFAKWLDQVILEHPIKAVYYEAVRKHIGVDAAHVYGGLMATLCTWCEKHKIPYGGVPVGTIKKHATGKGNASKDEVILAMSKAGHNPVDDNHADALALLGFIISKGGQL
ncbi:MAG: crossover junction endodeoxyribonuclease RuvC [Flavobacterium sp.]